MVDRRTLLKGTVGLAGVAATSDLAKAAAGVARFPPQSPERDPFRFAPIRNPDGSVKVSVREYPMTRVHVKYFDRQGKPVAAGEEVCQYDYLAFAPGINPLTVDRVEYDPWGYTRYCEERHFRRVRVFYREYEQGEHLAPETEGFNTLEEFEVWWEK